MKIKKHLTWPIVLAVNSLITANAADLILTAQCSSNRLSVLWNGAPGIRLQQCANLAGVEWQDVPGSAGASSWEFVTTNSVSFFRLISLGTTNDWDGDGLDNHTETNGWSIVVDSSGYNDPSIVEVRHVTSDPGLADTDGDGLDDYTEWLIGTDPRAADTDRDGLTDYEEWLRWLTSPTSVDTDGDARGPDHNLPPSATLFDGNELRLLHTSPTLDDTDGDGRTDYQEYAQPGRNLLVAEVPKLDVQLVDAVDVRLDVQYAEETGKTYQYGTELMESTTTSSSSYNENSMQASVRLGFEHTFGLFTGGTKVTGELSVGYGHVWATTEETATTAQNTYSQYSTDSRTRTETTASGSMSAGIRLVNTGPITYKLTDFGLTVRYWLPGGSNGTFKTLATLVPALGANGITLAPGDSTPVLQVQATGLNASRVKEFIARPNSLYLEPAYYELENAQGLNFDFLEEVTRWRTARVEIDYGDGRKEEHRVATNVERNQDGSYAGITMGNVMSNILQIPFQTIPRRSFQPTNATSERVLYSVRDVATMSLTNGFWIVAWSGAGAPQSHPDFDNVVLHAGDQILLMFVKDADGDGLFAAEELHYGTDDTAAADSDGDGLSDVFEARTGWDVVVLNKTNHVFSDPRQADQDSDGLTDFEEFQLGTDPTRPDTDDDGLADGIDPHPLVPAKVLRVKTIGAGGDGSTWANALTNLQTALSLAQAGLDTPTNSTDDVAEIWVAAGVYKPTSNTNRSLAFQLVDNTALYGGFQGSETKLSQRDPDPLFNGTVLSGDLLNNDASTYGENTNSFADNSDVVCFVPFIVGPGTTLDGFTITGGNLSGGMVCYGEPRLRNLLFRANHGFNGGGMTAIPGGEMTVSDCLFLQNSAEQSGGGMYICTQQPVTLTNCQFIQNETRVQAWPYGGGGVLSCGSVTMENCLFTLNSSAWSGGGVVFGGGTSVPGPGAARISRCEFRDNTCSSGGGGVSVSSYASWEFVLEVAQSVFWGNTASNWLGGGIRMEADHGRLYLLDSSFGRNYSYTNGAAVALTMPFTNSQCQGLADNCVIWGNTNAVGTSPAFHVASGCLMKVRTSCLPEASAYSGAGNINANPKFVDPDNGDLRLQAASPAIDRGNNYIDYFPTEPGFQLLPDADLDGYWRVLDGNNDGTATVDMGAYEYHAQ
jgi:hypothetical protein